MNQKRVWIVFDSWGKVLSVHDNHETANFAKTLLSYPESEPVAAEVKSYPLIELKNFNCGGQEEEKEDNWWKQVKDEEEEEQEEQRRWREEEKEEEEQRRWREEEKEEEEQRRWREEKEEEEIIIKSKENRQRNRLLNIYNKYGNQSINAIKEIRTIYPIDLKEALTIYKYLKSDNVDLAIEHLNKVLDNRF